MRTSTAIIADDEAPLRAFLRRRLASVWPELVIVGEAANGQEALELIEARRPDIAFLDIQMPVLTGLEVAARLKSRLAVVFVTAYDQYAIQAFEAAAVDYLLKPIGLPRLQMTVERLKAGVVTEPATLSALITRLAEELRPRSSYLQWLQSSAEAGMVMIAVADVDCFQAAGKYTVVVTRDKERLIRMSLKELEASLDPEHFWRVHRNAIVKISAIARVAHDFRGNYVVHLYGHQRTLTVGRSYTSRFKPS